MATSTQISAPFARKSRLIGIAAILQRFTPPLQYAADVKHNLWNNGSLEVRRRRDG